MTQNCWCKFCVRRVARSGVHRSGAGRGMDEEAEWYVWQRGHGDWGAGHVRELETVPCPHWPSPQKDTGPVQLNLVCFFFKETGNPKLPVNYLRIKIYLCIRWDLRDTSWAHSLNLSHWGQERPWFLRSGTRNSELELSGGSGPVCTGLPNTEEIKGSKDFIFALRSSEPGRKKVLGQLQQLHFRCPQAAALHTLRHLVCWPGSWPPASLEVTVNGRTSLSKGIRSSTTLKAEGARTMASYEHPQWLHRSLFPEGAGWKSRLCFPNLAARSSRLQGDSSWPAGELEFTKQYCSV